MPCARMTTPATHRKKNKNADFSFINLFFEDFPEDKVTAFFRVLNKKTYICTLLTKKHTVMKEIELVSKVKIYTCDELPESDRALVEMAKEATRTSYAPYSGFCVGAALRLADGTTVTGSNQENAAFPSGTCAERTALFYANAKYPGTAVKEMAVAAYTHGKFLKAPIPPCGACRQVILGAEERYGSPIRILLYGEEGTYVVETVKALLPLQFVGETMNE